MDNKLYICLVSDSNADRTDVVYVGNNYLTAMQTLWQKYTELKDIDTPDPDSRIYSDVAELMLDAVKSDGSAYIQFNDYHVNFECHSYDFAVNVVIS